MQSKARGVKLQDKETAPKIAQDAIRQIRDHLVGLNRACGFSDDAWKRFFRDENGFTLMLGYYFQGKPYLYTIDIDWCIPIPVRNSFKAIGCGASLGDFLLSEFREADPDFEYSDLIATAVIEKVIENVEGCGRPTWVGITHPCPNGDANAVFICRRELTDSIAQTLKEQEAKALPLKTKRLQGVLFSLCEKLGGLIYTDDDAGAFRVSIHSKNEKSRRRSLEKLIKADAAKAKK